MALNRKRAILLTQEFIAKYWRRNICGLRHHTATMLCEKTWGNMMSTNQSATQRELELELIRVRAEARAARLEAQAAELELMLRRMSAGLQTEAWHSQEIQALNRQAYHGPATVGTSHDAHPFDAAASVIPHAPAGYGGWERRVQQMQARQQPFAAPENCAQTQSPSIHWGSGRIDMAQLLSQVTTAAQPSHPLASAVPPRSAETFNLSSERIADVAPSMATSSDLMATSLSVDERPRATDTFVHLKSVSHIHRSEVTPKENGVADDTLEPALRIDAPHGTSSPKQDSINDSDKPLIKPLLGLKSLDRHLENKPSVAPELAAVAAAAAQVASENEEEQPTRWRPASWMLSTVAHVVVIVVLASMSLAVSPPKDQLAFSGSSGESDEAVIENFQIETNEPIAPSEPTESESAYDVSELGTLPVTEVNVDLPAMATPDTQMFTDLTSSTAQTSAVMQSLKGDQGPKTQFCGVDGGGKHFVYLVDSSNSMGSGFQSARAELLASIDQLKPDQRFYVVFFDEQPDYMRVSDSNVDDDASVMATPENKKRLRAWAMNVEMNKGKAPYDVLPFVLKLRPDVIFLLSDGEFPEKISQILREQNHQENLFGDSGPISIVHTIRYHGREGEEGRRAEATMVAIAKENSGQYRHVPKPKTN